MSQCDKHDARAMLELLVGLKKIKRKIEDGTATASEESFYSLTKEGAWEEAERTLASPSSTREPYLHPILAAHRGTPAYEEEKAALAVADRPRGTYVPFTVHEIDLIRACLDDGTYTAQERQDIGKLCDMAINCLLYGDEISRLRDTPVSATTPITDNDRRWRHLEHGCQWVSWTEINGETHSFDPRILSGYAGHLQDMRATADAQSAKRVKRLREEADRLSRRADDGDVTP